MTLIPKTQFIRSENHLRFISGFDCIGCEPEGFFELLKNVEQSGTIFADVYQGRSQAAHMRHIAECGMGLKPSDEWTLSLCPDCHRAHDAHPDLFWRGWLKDQVCMRLAKLSPDEKIREVV